MPTACVNQHDCRVSLKSERLEVFGRNEQTQRDEVLREIPIRDLDRLILTESVQITSQALAALLRANIPVSILGWGGQFLGGFLPAQNAHGLARLRQYRQTLDPAFALQIAGRIVTAKLYNQRRVLQRVGASRDALKSAANGAPVPATATDSAGNEPLGSDYPPITPITPITAGNEPLGPPASLPASASPGPNPAGHTPIPACRAGGTKHQAPSTSHQSLRPPSAAASPGGDFQSSLRWMDGLFSSIKQSRNVEELRGYEGAAAARYFETWAAFLPAEFPFERRSTRPPLNPVNACVSFGATLIYTEMVAFIHAHGLDPSLGFLHITEDGRWSLALDLMEPFRPVLVEALALDLFSHQILGAKHFEPKNGGVYLNEDGRKKFILQYERRMERQFLCEAVEHRTSLRQQLEEQAVMLKAALEDQSKFEPFLMN
jgi:CRISPR/Cas system-associated endonuclease Cas1